MLLYGGAFAVLLLLISGASAVPPPTNVNVTCRNTNVTVNWDYSKDHPQTEFQVNITSPSNKKVWTTKDHQHDLSEFVWKSDNNFMSQMSVSVTAIQGGNLSEAGISQMFTFNNLIPARLKCQLDFPPVDLDLKDSGATVTFKNPVHYFKELRKLNNGEMTFSVTTGGKDFKSDCPQDKEVCRLDFSYPDGVKDKCVNLTGLLWVAKPINFTKKHICPSSIEPYQIALIMVLICAGLVVTVVTIIICVTKAWTLKNASLPEFLEDFDENHRQQIATVCRTSTSSVTVYRPCRNPSVSSEDDGAGSDDSTDDSVKTECVSLYAVVDEEEEEEEEEEERAYDRPHVVQVNLGDGDMATGYTERRISL